MSTQKSSESFVSNKLLPFFSKFSTQKHLVTIRDAFGIVNPLIIAGAISLIGAIFLFGGSGGESTSILGWIAKASGGIKVDHNSWTFIGSWAMVSKIGSNVFSTATDATIGIFSIYISFEIAYVFTRAYKSNTDAVIAGLLSIASFTITAHGFSGGNKMFMGTNGLLLSILMGFISSSIFSYISKLEKLKIKMPKEVPPAVALGFSYIIPVLLTLISIGFIDSIALLIGDLGNIDITKGKWDSKAGTTITVTQIKSGHYGLAGLFYKGVGAPFMAFTSSSSGGLGIAVFYSFFVAFFWWFGLNGSSVMNGIFSPILIAQILKNTNLVSQYHGYANADANGVLSTVSITFLENYTQLTGWGMTGALIIATFIFSKIQARKEVAKIAAAPAIFNVNEPMTFGYPIMLNPIFAIPSMLIMPLNTIIAWLVIDQLGWVNKTFLMVPWTVPPGVGALLGTGFDWRAPILAWFCLGLAIVLYLPFVLIDNKISKKMQIKDEEIINFSTKGKKIKKNKNEMSK